jgi:hypothetical protein
MPIGSMNIPYMSYGFACKADIKKQIHVTTTKQQSPYGSRRSTPPSNRLSHRQRCPQTHEAWRYDIPAQNTLNTIMTSRRLPGWMRRHCLRSERSTRLQKHHANRHVQHPRTCWMEFSRLRRRHSGSFAERSHLIFSPA